MEGRFRVREVEWQYEGRVPGRVTVHLEHADDADGARPSGSV